VTLPPLTVILTWTGPQRVCATSPVYVLAAEDEEPEDEEPEDEEPEDEEPVPGGPAAAGVLDEGVGALAEEELDAATGTLVEVW